VGVIRGEAAGSQQEGGELIIQIESTVCNKHGVQSELDSIIIGRGFQYKVGDKAKNRSGMQGGRPDCASQVPINTWGGEAVQEGENEAWGGQRRSGKEGSKEHT